MIIQAVINELILQIKNSIGNGIIGEGLAIKDALGKVISISSPADFLGLDDRKGSYFYLRLNGTMQEQPSARKKGSCGIEIQARVPIKLVIQHRCQSSADLVDIAKFGLYNADFSGKKWGYDISGINLIPISSNFVPWQVYALETGNKETELQSTMQIASVDFIIELNYSYSNKCADFKLC